jgi:drug/metabolite transporter (DMT)-like permease
MSVGDHSNATLMVSIWGTTILGFGTLFVTDWFPSQTWVAPSLNHLGLFALAGLFMGAGQYCIIESLRVAEAGLVAPFKYVSFLWALLFGFVIWGDVPDHYELLGVSLIVGSGLFIFFRERTLARMARAPKL